MNRYWTNQEPNFFQLENFQGHHSKNFIEKKQKLSTKTYLNPQVVNYEFIKNSLSNGCLYGTNKILINPNFKGNRLNNTTHKDYPHVITSQNISLSEPGTSNTLSGKKENNSSLFIKDNILKSTEVMPYRSRFKKVNANSMKTNNKSSYSWCKNKTRDLELSCYLKNQKGVPAVKLLSEKISNNYNQTYKYISPKIMTKVTCKIAKSKVIYKSKTKIINESKTKLLNNVSPKTKLSTPLKRNMNLSKFGYDKSKKSSILRVAKAVKSKYKYLNNLEQYKKSKYKLDKRSKSSEDVKRKSTSKEIRDIRKLFPNYLYNKIKLSSYNVYSLDRCRAVSKSKCLLRKNQPLDKVNQNINHFQNRRVVKIGGILYKSTTTKLTLASQKVENSSKKAVTNKSRAKKSCVVYVRGEKFTLENNGRALKRQSENLVNDKTFLLTPKRIDIGGVTYLRKSNNVLIRTNVHQARNFVNKAKNKSIALLTNLHKRSSMPCMIYHRFGKCNRHNKGLCMYKHDPKNIAVCKKFLKGDCSGNNCLLSHQIIQEKMATCHFFLKGLCVKENCPFLHVKLSKNAAICKNFLQGFCNLGKECSKRHLNLCPEFDKYGTCNLGSKCHYPHKKLKTEEISQPKEKQNLSENGPELKDENETVQYYLYSGIEKKQKKNKKSVRKLKEKTSPKNQKEIKGLTDSTLDQSKEVIKCFPKRIKLEKLPCYIPLNSGS